MLGVIFLIGCFLYPFVMLFGACILEILAYLIMGVGIFFIWILESMGRIIKHYEDKKDEEDMEYYFEELEQLKLETIKKVKEKM